MNFMNRWVGVVTAAAFLAVGAPTIAHARGADDKTQQLPKPHKVEKPRLAGKASLTPPPVNPKQRKGHVGMFAAKASPAPRPLNPNQQQRKGQVGMRVA